MKIYTYLLTGLLFCTATGFAQEVLQFTESESAGKGRISELAWLTGNWKGTGLGGECDELWMPAGDNSMQGVFRFYEKGKLQFTEYMNIIQEDSSLSLKLKHFSDSLIPWEEKEKWVTFKLIKIENQTAYFNGLTYHRKKNKLVIKLYLHHKEKSWIETFIFYKTKL
jgi:hypothetical protein